MGMKGKFSKLCTVLLKIIFRKEVTKLGMTQVELQSPVIFGKLLVTPV